MDLAAELHVRTLEHAKQKQDYEDLLVLLEDQDSKIKIYKVRGAFSKYSVVEILLVFFKFERS